MTVIDDCVRDMGEGQRTECGRPEIMACDGNLILSLDASGRKVLSCNSEAMQARKAAAALATPLPPRAVASSGVPTLALVAGGVVVAGLLVYFVTR